jgi:hypothetical protein
MTRSCWSSSWYRRIIRVILLHYSHKSLTSYNNSATSCQQVVIALLVPSCPKIGDNLLTCNNLAELSELLLWTSPEHAWYTNIVTIVWCQSCNMLAISWWVTLDFLAQPCITSPIMPSLSLLQQHACDKLRSILCTVKYPLSLKTYLFLHKR